MSERGWFATLTFLLVAVLLVAAGVFTWWSEKRFTSLDERLSELEPLGRQLDRLSREVKGELSKLEDIQKAIAGVQKSTAPLVRVDRSVDLLTDKVGKDIAPSVARISELTTGMASTHTQVRALSDALSKAQKELAEQTKTLLATHRTETAQALKTQQEAMASELKKLDERLKVLSESEAGLGTELTKLSTQLKGLSAIEASVKTVSGIDGKLTTLTKELQGVSQRLNGVSEAVTSLKKQLLEIEKRLPAVRKPGPAA